VPTGACGTVAKGRPPTGSQVLLSELIPAAVVADEPSGEPVDLGAAWRPRQGGIWAFGPEIPHTRRYRLTKTGYSICLIFLKLFERIYAPLTAGLLRPVAGLPPSKRSQLERLYQRIVDDADQLFHAVGLKIAA
jgi:hypothetical protein